MGYDWEKYYADKPDVWTREDEELTGELVNWSTGSVVDLGCGEGADTIWMAEQGWKVTAVDQSKTALRRVLARAKEKNLKVTATCSDILKFVPNEPFDLVYLGFIHFPAADRPALFRKCKSLMKMNGKLLIICLVNPLSGKDVGLPIDSFPNIETLQKELREAGLRAEKAEEIYREIKWSEEDGFVGETGLIVATKD